LTVTNHAWKIKALLTTIDKPVELITKGDLRNFLIGIRERYSVNTYSAFIKAIRRFFRDYLNKPELATFKFPTIPFTPKMLMFEKEDLQRFHEAIQHPVVKMLFMGYCVTGLRRNDLLYLKKNELFLKDRMIIKNNASTTKHRWVTFYNEELGEKLFPYLESRTDSNLRVFVVDKWKTFARHWKMAQKEAKLHITPKDLRDWFCVEMTNLGVTDRYIDAFCGRVPKTVLGRHYTDYSPHRLKKIYDKANLRLLS
jgi:integrase